MANNHQAQQNVQNANGTNTVPSNTGNQNSSASEEAKVKFIISVATTLLLWVSYAPVITGEFDLFEMILFIFPGLISSLEIVLQRSGTDATTKRINIFLLIFACIHIVCLSFYHCLEATFKNQAVEAGLAIILVIYPVVETVIAIRKYNEL